MNSQKIKNHAGYTYLILSEVNDFEEIRDWAIFIMKIKWKAGILLENRKWELNERNVLCSMY